MRDLLGLSDEENDDGDDDGFSMKKTPATRNLSPLKNSKPQQTKGKQCSHNKTPYKQTLKH